MTKSADQELASPSSPFPAYVFEGPAQVAIRTRTNDQPKYVDTRLPIWTWYNGGLAMTIDWAALHLNPDIMQIAKAFVAYALEKYAPDQSDPLAPPSGCSRIGMEALHRLLRLATGSWRRGLSAAARKRESSTFQSIRGFAGRLEFSVGQVECFKGLADLLINQS